VTTIDPGAACDTPSFTTIQNLYDELVTTPGTVVHPMLATSWATSNGGRTYTFQLRHGVVFASGNRMTAADVVFSLKYALAQAGCEAYVLNSGFNNLVKSVTATGPYTVVVHLAHPDPIFLQTLSQQVMILDSKVVEAHGGLTKAAATWLSSHAAGSGPFALQTYEPDSEIVLVARKNYWGGDPRPSKVVIRIIADPSSMELLTGSGAIKMAFSVPQQDLPKLAANPNVKLISNPSQFYISVGFDLKHTSPVDNPVVREALTYATPVSQVASAYSYGQASGFWGPILPVMPGYNHAADPYPYNPGKARNLLKGAGIHNLSLTLTESAGYPLEQDIATVLQSAWRAVGVNLTIDVASPSQYAGEVYAWKDEMYITTDGPQASIDPGFFLAYHIACNAFNYSGYCNSTVTNLVNRARTISNPSVSIPLYQRAAAIAREAAPYIYFLSLNHVVVASKNLTGYTYYADQATRFNTIGLR
jgi:peptide/nickel transport system substrate-binding protein